MDLNSVKSFFNKGKAAEANGKTPPHGKAAPRGAGKTSAPAQKGKAGRGGGGGAAAAGSGAKGAKGAKSGKVAPVSPARARLERRANDEKIIKYIKIVFTTVIAVAVVGIALSIFLYAYKPTVATVGGMGISQYELTYQLKLSSAYASQYSTPQTIGEQAIDSAKKAKINEIIAKERGYQLTKEDTDSIKSQLDSIEQYAASGQSGAAPTTGDDYLRANIGVTKSQYRKIMQSEMLAGKLLEAEYEKIIIPDEDALQRYETDPADYKKATVRHILFLYEGKQDAETPRTHEESEQLANDTVKRIEEGEDMAGLVQELSEDNDLSNEGIYTFKRTDSYEQGFLDWTFAAGREIGEVGVCETSYGYHVMRLEGMDMIPFDEVKEDVVGKIKTEQLNKIKEEWVNESRFKLQINQRVFDSVVAEVLGA